MMNRKFLFWENPKQAVLTLMYLLMGIGCINIFSASYAENSVSFFYKYIFFAVLGTVAIVLIRKAGYKRFLNRKFVNLSFWLVLVMLALVKWSPLGIKINGASRWLNVPGFTLQPSELVKLVIIMMAARYLGELLRKHSPVVLDNPFVLRIIMASGLCAGLVLIQPDLGTAAIILAIAACMLLVAGLPMLQFGLLSLLGAAAAFIFHKPYHLERVKAWLDPWADPVEKGYQTVQAQLTIGSGGLWGTKWGEGTFKIFHLPEAHTDFAFAVFCQENGFVGVCVLTILFLLLGCALYAIAMNAKDERGFLLASGVSLLVVGQAVSNMAMVCGILPVIGVPMVFISYGGTALLVAMISIGLVLSVYDDEVQREEALAAAEPEERRNDLRVVSRRWRPQ